MHGLYIHIPFCKQKCNYCDFVSFPGQHKDRVRSYIEALGREMKLYPRIPLSTVYLGGGTPSLLDPEDIRELFRSIHISFDCMHLSEITAEANPESLTEERLKAFRVAGVNRLSIGVQSFQRKNLSYLGRIHSAEEALSAYHAARKTHFSNISLDLIYGAPDQTTDEWQKDLRAAVELAPEHLSLYPLTIEPDTPFYTRGTFVLEENQAEMYEWSLEYLASTGYEQYEISNWSRPGYQCRHNLTYWNNGQYRGIGVAAASYCDGVRTKNTLGLDSYLASVGSGVSPVEEKDPIDENTRISEEIILKLRTRCGVPLSPAVTGKYDETIKKLISRDLLEQHGPAIRLTKRGLLLANQVMKEFV